MEKEIKLEATITTERTKMAFYDCDYRRRAKLSTILKMTAEAAGQDYTNKGLGHEFLWDNGYVFLVSRISIHIKRYPEQKEIMSATTWECGRSGAQFLRGYTISDESGETCIDGISGWVLVHPETRKIYRPSQFPWQMPQITDREISALPIGKIEAENLEKIGEHVVRIPDLDANGHVYNANYADIASEFMPEELFGRDVVNFRINFVNEAKLGDVIELFLEDAGERAVVIGRVDGKNCFECEYIYTDE